MSHVVRSERGGGADTGARSPLSTPRRLPGARLGHGAQQLKGKLCPGPEGGYQGLPLSRHRTRGSLSIGFVFVLSACGSNPNYISGHLA